MVGAEGRQYKSGVTWRWMGVEEGALANNTTLKKSQAWPWAIRLAE